MPKPTKTVSDPFASQRQLIGLINYPQPHSFKHFLFFCFEFDLVASAELEAIESLVARMRQEYQAQGCSHGTPAVPENGGVVSGHQAHMESQEAMAVAGGP